MALNDETMKKNTIIDLNIDGIEKTKIRINGNNDSILELNLSDVEIGDRLEKGYENLYTEIKKIAELDVDDENLSKILKDADKAMRGYIDYIFDSNVSEVCCKSGTMFDLDRGVYKFERILEALTKLYSDNINSEYKAMKKRLQQVTEKYQPQDHKPKATKKRK